MTFFNNNFSEKSNQKEYENLKHESYMEEIDDNESYMEEIVKENNYERIRNSNKNTDYNNYFAGQIEENIQ